MSNHTIKMMLVSNQMIIFIFLKFGMVKLLKSLYNVVDVEKLPLQIKIIEYMNILLFLIKIFIKIWLSFCLPKCLMAHLLSKCIANDHSWTCS